MRWVPPKVCFLNHLSSPFPRRPDVFFVSLPDERLKDKMTILSGKVESVTGFYVSMRLSEERKSIADEEEDGESHQTSLGTQRWKGLVLGTKKHKSEDLAKTIQTTQASSTSSSLVRGASTSRTSSASSKFFEWQGVASLVKEQPDTRLEVSVHPWVARNNTLASGVQQLVDFLGMEFNEFSVRIG